MTMSRRRIAALATTAALAFGACSGGATWTDPRPHRRPLQAPRRRRPPSRFTITWYHIQNNDPGLSLWKALADEYTAAHPNVTIDIQVNENERSRPS